MKCCSYTTSHMWSPLTKQAVVVQVGVNSAFRGGAWGPRAHGVLGLGPACSGTSAGSVEFPRCLPAFVAPSCSLHGALLWRRWVSRVFCFSFLGQLGGWWCPCPQTASLPVPFAAPGCGCPAVRDSSVSTAPSQGPGVVLRSPLLHVDACGERGWRYGPGLSLRRLINLWKAKQQMFKKWPCG